MNSLRARDIVPALSGLSREQLNEEYKTANSFAANCEENIAFANRGGIRAEVRAAYIADCRDNLRFWVNRAADCVKAYRALAA